MSGEPIDSHPMVGLIVIEAPWGPVHVAADEDTVVLLEVLATAAAFAGALRRRLGEAVGPPRSSMPVDVLRPLDAAAEAVAAHLAGEPDAFAGLAFELRGLSAWDRLVLNSVRHVPWGQVTSCGRLARTIGRPGMARAVGDAVGRNPIGLIVPCHRVIACDGSLGGYGGGWAGGCAALLAIKRRMLALEGVELPAHDLRP